jgi:PAS domain-containing protein
MILIRKSYLYATLIFVCFSLLGMGAAGYRVVGGMPLLSFFQQKYQAENFLFYGVVALIAVLVLFLVMIGRSVRVFNEIDKVTQLSRRGRYYSGHSLKRLGPLGERIDGLFSELNRLNDMKSLKISSLSQLAEFLLDNVPLHLLVLNRTGVIERSSQRFKDTYGVDADGLNGSRLSDFLKDVKVDEVLQRMEKNRSVEILTDVTALFGKGERVISVEFIPLFNSLQELASIICAVEKETILTDLARKAEKINIDVTGVPRRVGDLFRKMAARRKRE